MSQLEEYFEVGLKFHGHKCPAMPMGLRAGLAAMNALGVERAKNKELIVRSETGKGHAAGCFLDGIMTATGCTYGKSNIENLEQNRSNPSPARVLCRASLPSTLAGQLALFQIAPGDLVPIFVQPSLPDFPESPFPS